MAKRYFKLAVLALLVANLNSCSKQQDASNLTQGLSDEIQQKIDALGFNAEGAYAADGGYIVEGDIFLTKEDLEGHTRGKLPSLIIGDSEQYHTFNLVTGTPRTITISSSGKINNKVSNAIDAAIARYNNENLTLTFQRVSSNGDINIRIVNGGSYIASAGFPSGGDPYGEVKFNKQYQNYPDGFLTTVIAHEVGHCIGFRHTDWMNRSYSCGTGGSEGQQNSGVGAVHIQGTPTGPDSGSWMLACLGSNTNRPFNNNDKTALNYLY